MASHNILLGYDNALSKLSHVELVGNALKVTDNNLTKLDSIDTRLDNCDSSLNTIEAAIGFVKSRLYDSGTNLGAGEILELVRDKLSAIKTDTSKNSSIDTHLNNIDAETSVIQDRLYDTGTSKSAGEILNLILSAVNNMGASISNNVELDFKTEYINRDTGTIVLENDKTGQYHLVADDMTIKQIKTIQMGETGTPDYTISIKVYNVGGGGALTLASTNNYNISVQSIIGMNSINYYTNQPTKTGLVFHFPFDYSDDDVMN